MSNYNKQEKAKDSRLKRVYGITLAEYNELLQHQDNKCYICHRPPINTTLAVDHKHQKRDKKLPGSAKRGHVRGLLCWSCNKGLSFYKDDAIRFTRAASYLNSPPAKKVIKE